MRRSPCPIGPTGRPGLRRHRLTVVAVAGMLALTLPAPIAGARESARSAGSGPVTGMTTAAIVDSDGDGLRDGFERRYGLDPQRKDTNHDGLIDSVADPDHDNLGNLGEQQSGTNPRQADTDRDGILDGAEDFDHNGVDNRHQQDQRPVPSGLRPALADAFQDKPAPYADDCLNGGDQVQLNPCVYGDPEGATTIVLVGDSHAAQWLPAFARAGLSAHWRIVLLAKSSCPAADVTWANGSVFPSCEPWRTDAFAWLAANPPALVVLASARRYTMYDADRKPLAATAARAAWAAAFSRSIAAMPATSRVMVLADTPWQSVDVPVCLAGHLQNMARCGTLLRVGSNARWVKAERQATQAAGATYAGLNRLVCPYDPCPVVNGTVLMWRDDSHITATFSRMLGPSLLLVLQRALGES